LDYSGALADGRTATQISFNQLTTSNNETVYLSDGTISSFGLDSFERFEITGTAGNDAVTGGLGNDVFRGGAGNDTLAGGQGNDTLIGGFGSDVLDGGSGIDTVSYADSRTGVDIGFTRLGSGGTAEGDQLFNVEVIVGSDFSDVLIANGTGTTVDGGAGPDTLRDRDGAGGATLIGGSGQDSLYGRDGNDTLYGGTQNDFLSGGEDDDVLYGEDGNDRLRGDGGADTMYGGIGTDNMIGGLGNDVLYGDAGRDYLFGEDGDDILDGGVEQDFLSGGVGNDTLVGGTQTDRLYGGDGADVLYGDGIDSGRDFLFGDAGDDTIYSAHDDVIEGGLGADTFVFATGFQRGTIRDFEAGTDLIDLSAVTELLRYEDLTFRQIGDRVRIDFNDLEGDHLILEATTLSSLNQTDFVFNFV
jgi:Ca2+-binding RTX toxin-like protein